MLVFFLKLILFALVDDDEAKVKGIDLYLIVSPSIDVAENSYCCSWYTNAMDVHDLDG